MITDISISKKIFSMEDKINRFLRQLKEKSIISESTYYKMYASGCSPGILYGNPKIHK